MRAQRLLPLLLVCLPLVAACSPGAPATVQPAAKKQPTSTAVLKAATAPLPTATPEPPPEPTATMQPRSAVIERQIMQIEAGAASVRGLDPLYRVPEVFISRQQFQDNLKKEAEKDKGQSDADQYQIFLWLARLSDQRSLDIYKESVDMHSEGVLGYYDPFQKKLFVIGDQKVLDPQAREALAHEYIHSLQDQHYDLAKLLIQGSSDSDRSLAGRSLIEGDATITGYSYAAEYMTAKDYKSLFAQSKQADAAKQVYDSAPPYITALMLFPYTEGPNFVQALTRVDYFAAVNLAISDPPRSTEQILHPEKYIQSPRDAPQLVTLPPLTSTLGTGWTYKYEDTIGEFDLRSILQENGAGDPVAGAAGWGGGEYAIYQNGDAALMYTDTTWDTQKDADEFYGSMYETFKKTGKDGDFWTDGARFFGVREIGKSVLFVASTDRKALESTITAARD
ncbi:MAG: hypothetical protein IVW55_14250 [Chloroflexi bacterium]|nr:hypothetical protein [Chloroflexota bacterium]